MATKKAPKKGAQPKATKTRAEREASARAGDPKALVEVVEAHREGGQKEKARALLLPLAEKGNALAQQLLGTLVLQDDDDEAAGLAWYRKAAEQGDEEAGQSALWLLRKGMKVQDKAEADRFLEARAAAGDEWAIATLKAQAAQAKPGKRA
jgi:TPR repeat protein